MIETNSISIEPTLVLIRCPSDTKITAGRLKYGFYLSVLCHEELCNLTNNEHFELTLNNYMRVEK